MSIKTILSIIIITTCAFASPAPSKKELDAKVTMYDQRQEGEWNVRAHLDNFVILIIPTPSVSSSSPTSPSLLDFLMKSLPRGTHLKRVKHVKKHKPDAAQETMHFIESKTAPYHVDITKTKSQVSPKTDDILVASSPSITLVNAESETPILKPIHKKRSARVSKAFILTVPAEEERPEKNANQKKVLKKDKKRKIAETHNKHELQLLGAENEQCGPGLVRDSYGICRIHKNQ